MRVERRYAEREKKGILRQRKAHMGTLQGSYTKKKLH
jgi:hypothetical protein